MREPMWLVDWTGERQGVTTKTTAPAGMELVPQGKLTSYQRSVRGRKPWLGCCADENEAPAGGNWARWPKGYRKIRRHE
ncbi:MAG TPA: hypothetical protein PLI70_08750 [Gemmatimonadales bacterium]|nr:hypothetical protein [Gemmatimonadales bacterium]